MATTQDVINKLIEQTKSGDLEWRAGTDSGGYWHTTCGEIHFQVRRSGLVEVYGRLVPTVPLGDSPEIAKLLEQFKPLDPAIVSTRDEALQIALRCLTEKKRNNSEPK